MGSTCKIITPYITSLSKNGVFIFVISHIIPEIFTIFVLCKLGTDDVIRCDSMEVETQSREYLCK